MIKWRQQVRQFSEIE